MGFFVDNNKDLERAAIFALILRTTLTIMNMRTLLIAILAFTTTALVAQRKPKIKGNKQITTVREELPPFTAIELSDDLDIYLEKRESTGFTVMADDNLIDILRFEVRDSLLTISSFYKIISKKKLEITVHYDDLEKIVIREGSIAMADVISTDVLKVETYGNSRLELRALADFIEIAMEGSSKGDMNLEADSLAFTLKERSDLKAYSVSEGMHLEMFRNTAARLDGSSQNVLLKMHGNSNLKAQDLQIAQMRAELDETPTARVHVFRDLQLVSRGGSKLYLYGVPKIEIIEFLDSSELLKRPEQSRSFLSGL